MKSTFYALWLPIIDFLEFEESIAHSSLISNFQTNSNNNWTWVKFSFEEVEITIDSLGFVYLDHLSEEGLDEVLTFLAKNLNRETRENIESTFLNRNIGYEERESEGEAMFHFLQGITLSFPSPVEQIKFEYIKSTLTLEKKVLYNRKETKFSLSDENENFYTILNRNFQNLLQKSLFFTHGLHLERGELYELSITDNVYETIKESLPKLKLKVNGKKETIEKKENIFRDIIHKVIQDTIEEKILLNFLKVTKLEYLSNTIHAISENNDILKTLNSYLLEDLNQEKKEREIKLNREDLDDESATEIFIQNLLQVIPKFYMMDTKIQEAYYIKVGNTTTNLNVKKEETILTTLYYRKWKASINFFIETATKAKESLGMYHQNKTLKELEDISYNANYQADIEDIRELQKNKALSLDENTRNIFLFLAVVTLAGEAPILEISDPNVFWNILYNITEIVINFSFYLLVLLYLVVPFIVPKGAKFNFKTFFNKNKENNLKALVHEFEESDYDKHEHRSSRSLYSYDEGEKKYVKIFVEYNNLLSSYSLVKQVKEVVVRQKTHTNTFEFSLFPLLLQEALIGEKKKHTYRENYRISGNDRVATKVMYRYKINELTLESLLDYMSDDNFMKNYETYLEDESRDDFSIKDAIAVLRSSDAFSKKRSKMTLYIVYSFVLKFYEVKEENENIYRYSISKDQFRVHYHINMLDYKDDANFKKKQESLAKLVDIYFLKRLKRFKEVEIVNL